MKNQKLKQLLKEKIASDEMQPQDDIMFLNQDELNQIGGSGCGMNMCTSNTGNCTTNNCNNNHA